MSVRSADRAIIVLLVLALVVTVGFGIKHSSDRDQIRSELKSVSAECEEVKTELELLYAWVRLLEGKMISAGIDLPPRHEQENQ